MISHKHKFIFIHIPKCAGISIELFLNGSFYVEWDEVNKIWMQHATASQIKDLYVKNYEDYFSFTFVRNPWSRAVSDYFWLKRTCKFKGSLKNFLLLKGGFDTPRLSYPHLDRFGRGDHIIPQSDFVLDANGKRMVDFIGRFENLQEDFDIICDKIGIPKQQLPHRNGGNHKNYIKYYNKETRQLVAKKYAKDIEYFNYEFGE